MDSKWPPSSWRLARGLQRNGDVPSDQKAGSGLNPTQMLRHEARLGPAAAAEVERLRSHDGWWIKVCK